MKQHQQKILFIEDMSALQHAMTQTLVQEGYQVYSALDGSIGLAIARKEMPDLILLDLILPGMDGFTVLAELKKQPDTTHIPVIVLSNLGGPEDIEKALRLGAAAYLVKTEYRLEEVLKKIKEVLHAKSQDA
ncbi:MAG: response regulator with CheY-like receiver domain and winged-helix DNA-binding domain [Parcubacteria group bacterium Gr01-1014_66]|nr:MAG: response regulator with CheY-like receiver domain and winged-helix DNA-binding domain [Parcubacteria group bacterium Gr01-1014_66]